LRPPFPQNPTAMDGGGGGVGGGGVGAGVMVGGGVGPGGGVGGDVELVSKTLQFEHKLFYFDLKENPRGRYLKISEKTSATRSTIIVPVDGVAWFLDLFDYYIRTDERDAFSKELRLQTKVSARFLRDWPRSAADSRAFVANFGVA
jgi:transcriptional activator protein Pur-alpha